MGLWSRIKRTFRGDGHIDEIQEELDFHLHMDAAGGHSPRETRLRLGNVTRIEEETRAMGIVDWLDSVLQDVRYGARQLRKTPALVAAVVLSLGIGVGANTAIFSLVDAALLKPLPVKDPGSLRIIEWTYDGFPPGVQNHNGYYRPVAGGLHAGTSIPPYLYRRLVREQTAFETLVGVAATPDSVAIASDTFPAEQASLQYASANFFQGLGVQPPMGRPFQESDDRVGAEPVVVVSHRFWMSRLGGRPEALGSHVRINTVLARVVGVAPAGFFGLRAGQWPDLYAPFASKVAFQAVAGATTPRGEQDWNWWVRPFGRVRPEITDEAARVQLATLLRNLVPPEGGKRLDLVMTPGRRGIDALNATDTNALWILMLLVGVLLLIVCANVANLLLSRSVGRQRETSVRLALGAGRGRLFRQHLIESGVLATLGGAAGLALGYVLAQSIHLLFQTGRDSSNAFDLHLDLRALGYTAGLSMLAALLFGLAPAIRAARADFGAALKTQTRSVIGGGLRLPRVLVSAQIALCLTAVVAAGLLGRSLGKLKWADVGFDRENLVYATVSPVRAGYAVDRLAPYADRVREELSRIPGVVRVSTVQSRPLAGWGNNGRVHLPGREWGDTYRANLNLVGDGFFETMRIPVVAGRAFERRDIRPKTDAVIVDERFAKQYFPGENPVGRRFGMDPKDSNRYEIVGVVGDSGYNYNSLRGQPSPTVYQPYPSGGTINFVIRSSMDSARLALAVRQAVASVDPSVPVTEFHTQNALIDRALRTERLLGFVSGTFGIVALLLAAVGLGGLLAYMVARRTNELGVRIALGASGADVIRMVLRDSLGMLAAGAAVGLPCAWAVGRFLKTALFGLEPLDPATTTGAFLALLTVALLAAWLPARRAARIDPMTALREE